MHRIIIGILVGLCGGLALAALVTADREEPVPAAPPAPGFDRDAAIEDRLAALEAAVSQEREARQLLEEELFALYETLETLDPAPAAAPDAPSAVAAAAVEEEARRRIDRRRESAADNRVDMLTRAGFSPARAEWITERESALRMEAMQARYEMMREGGVRDPLDPSLNPDALLRAELGDSDYERYLEASGRPTAVGVRDVFSSSPAMTAGLQPGDRITHYDGERVYSTMDLIRRTVDGEAGERVVVNIERDGTPMQIVMPRGPLGVSTRPGR